MSNFTAGTSILPGLRAPKLKRQQLRKYSWLPDVFRLKGSIISRIAGPVFTVTLFATAVAYTHSQGYRLVMVNSIVPLLSVVVGLILVFRNSTSYDRYWEGRKAFATMVSNARNLSRLIWVNVAPPPTTEQPPGTKGKTPTSNHSHAEIRRRKAEAVRLTMAYVVAVKHYLREEDGLGWDDFDGLIPNSLAFYDTDGYGTLKSAPSTLLSRHHQVDSPVDSKSGHTTPDGSKVDPTRRIRPKRSKARISTLTSSTPLLTRSLDFRGNISMPLPLVIAYELTKAVFLFRKDGYLETVGPAGTNSMTQMVQSMSDQLSTMERIANTPIPRSYGIHLKQCVSLYLFALPLTLVNELGWGAVPLVTVVAFTFMGIEGIAEEIEMPFGTDDRDLPLDRYCEDLREEIDFLIERLPESGEGLHGYDDGEGDD
ncbi:UPF0187-domain-containing protein [Pluteus cervinus]|uniref:UPF0187-domain-containing protein n=1 Tax=Pluteus cervinus TaxID=181527 RepID=A0ACD3B3Q7_9AGAR|nr:UPF0187-domain-containing protein [Pluteus cervinus]